MKIMLGLRQKRIIGLDIDEGSAVATELIKKQKAIYLAKYAVVLNLQELLKDVNFKGAEVIINLPTQVILFRTFHIAPSLLNSKNKQKNIIGFLSRQNLPFKLEECFWNTFVLGNNFNLIAAKKEVVEKYIAQVQALGLRVAGVTTSLVALYNVLIYSYPEREKDRFAILNIKATSSDLLIYEAKRLWVYPLSIGKRNLTESPQDLGKFPIEIQRLFNAHYLQNPRVTEKTPSYFYLGGQETSEELISSLKNVLGDFEILVLEPFKRISILNKEYPAGQQMMSLSLGLAFTYLQAPFCLRINLIEEKLKKEQNLVRLNFFKKASLYFIILAIVSLLFWDVILLKNLKRQFSIYKNTSFQISSALPEIETLKEEKDKLQKLQDFLEKRLNQQRLYLKALSEISASKPSSIAIKEFDAQLKDAQLGVFLSGSAPTYQEINDFLTKLKKNEDVKEVKVVASTFSTLETQGEGIDFKLRFEVTDINIKPEEVDVSKSGSNSKKEVTSLKKK